MDGQHIGCCCGGCGCSCHQVGDPASRAVDIAGQTPDPRNTRRGRWDGDGWPLGEGPLTDDQAWRNP